MMSGGKNEIVRKMDGFTDDFFSKHNRHCFPSLSGSLTYVTFLPLASKIRTQSTLVGLPSCQPEWRLQRKDR